jgi:hypothetical protein
MTPVLARARSILTKPTRETPGHGGRRPQPERSQSRYGSTTTGGGSTKPDVLQAFPPRGEVPRFGEESGRKGGGFGVAVVTRDHLRTYAHVMPGGQEQAARAVSESFSGLRRKETKA